MEKIKKVLRGEKGFTLIEIIVVLIILGILAAVIMPKYFGLEDEAGQKVAEGVLAELQARGNLLYASVIISQDGNMDEDDFKEDLLENLKGEDGDNYKVDLSSSTASIQVLSTNETFTFTYEKPVWPSEADPEKDSHGPRFIGPLKKKPI